MIGYANDGTLAYRLVPLFFETELGTAPESDTQIRIQGRLDLSLASLQRSLVNIGAAKACTTYEEHVQAVKNPFKT